MNATHTHEKQYEKIFSKEAMQCSCATCDAFLRLKLNNKDGFIPYDACSTELNESKPVTERNLSNKTFKIDTNIETCYQELIKKEITYDENSDIGVILPKTFKQESLYSGATCESTDRMFDGSRSNIPTEMASFRSGSKVSFPGDLDSTTMKLSAQIMNVPYKDFKGTLFTEKPKNSYTENKLNRFDILNRIKEAYKACSCKVCECIIGKTSIYKEVCKCKPCECADCVAFMNNLRYGGIVARDGCPCASCSKKECKGKNKFSDAPYCECEPGNYLKYYDTYNNPCNCKPCECIDCKFYSEARSRNIIVGRMEEDVPHRNCNCSPCDCTECVQRLPIASTLRHEMSTGISRPTNCTCDSCLSQACETNDSGTCTCEVQKRLMRKPVEKDTHDYDIHRASIISNNIIENVKNNTLAMFASISNNYLKPANKSRSCDCEQCECIVCKGNDLTINKKVSILLEELDSTQNFTTQNHCKCLPCECEVCCEENRPNDIIFHNAKTCNCDVCDCLQCDDLNKRNDQYNIHMKNNKKMKKIYFSKNVCKCEPCECHECESTMYKCTREACSCSNCKCKMCTDEGMFYNNANDYGKLPQQLETDVRYDDTKGQPTIKIQKFEVVKPVENNFISHHANNNVIDEKDCMSAMESVYKPRRIDYTNNAHSKEHVENNQKTSTASGCFITDGPLVTPIHDNKILHKVKNNYNSFYPRKEVDKCLNDVMESDLYKETAFGKFDTLDNTSSQWSDIHVDVKENVSERPENSNLKSFPTKEDVQILKEPSIHKVISLNKININAHNKHCNQNTNIKTMSIELMNSLRTANTQLDSIYNKSRTSPKEVIQGNEATRQDNKENNIQDTKKDNEKNKNNSDLHYKVDFDKANRTLQEAKAFSLELIRLLKLYENANKKYAIDLRKYQNDKRISDIAIRNDENKSFCYVAENDRFSDLPQSNDRNSQISIGNLEADRKVRGIFNKDTIGSPNRKQATGDIFDLKNTKAKPKFPSSFTVSHHGEHIYEQYKYDRGSNLIFSNSKSEVNHFVKTKSTHSYNFNSCNEHITSESFAKNTNENISECQSIYTENINKNTINNGNYFYKPRKCFSISTSTITADQTDITFMEQMNQMLKKNFASNKPKSFFNSPLTATKPLSHISILTLEVQNAMRSLSRQYNQDDYYEKSSKHEIKDQNRDKPLNKISLERNNVFTGSTQTCKINEDAEKGVDCTDLCFGSTGKSSCDFLKVKILGLRKISDHTVLVKWKSPQDVNNVHGYELLVDGRAVQKILSPCRCMAVVSNLPHLDQVLITIRTLTTKCGHFPAATIVYRPRNR